MRRCPFCGVDVPAGGHSGCPGLFREIMSDRIVKPDGPDPARTLRQYSLVEIAGRGGMGEVWKAWDTKLERWVAIKFLLGASDDDAARFLREARLAARLRHPNIAVVHEVGEHDGRQFLVMDFIDGETLAAARLDLEPALRCWIAVARAVDAAHRAGIIHRDLKPQNILLTREGWPFVTDFGLAKPMAPGGTLSASGAVVGTPAYMPPEQAAGRLGEIDERSDVYALGATFYRVLTGSDPFEAPTALALLRLVTEEEPRAPRDRNPKLPAAVDTVIRKCLSKRKGDRYHTALDLAEDLERILAGSRIRGRAPGPLTIAFRRMRRSAVSLALSAALLALAGVVAWREWPTKAPTPPLAAAPKAPEPSPKAIEPPAPTPEPVEPPKPPPPAPPPEVLVPLRELDEVDLVACLKSADPEQELDRTRKRLVGLQSRTGVDLESRRRLETLMVLASAYRSLLKGATEEDVVRELADSGPKLRSLGGASDPGDVSPRVKRILDSLLGR